MRKAVSVGIVAVLLGLLPVAGWAQERRVLLIVAHPDDESAFGEVLARHAARGDRVDVIIATDGKGGTRVTDVPAGDRLGALRREESRCAAKAIGLAPPEFLGIERLDTQIGTGRYFAEHKRLMAALKTRIDALAPDVILTFGPDGDTSHAEHVVIGAAVTALLLREGWVDRFPLYYLAWTPQQGRRFDLGYVADPYLNVRIAYSQEEEDKALGMMPCYATQYTAEEIAQDRADKLADTGNTLHFRRFTTARGMADGF